MGIGNEDARVAFAIERLLESGDGWRALLRDMVLRWPSLPIYELSFTLVSAAVAIESNFEGMASGEGAGARAYKLAALLSLDVYAMELLEMPRGRASDLLAYWELDPVLS